MFQLRAEHNEAFQQSQLDRFVARQTLRLQGSFPEELEQASLAVEALNDFIRQAIEAAASYGVTREQDVELYLDLTLLLGPDFDRDAQYPWAGETLRRTDLSGTAKADLLHDYLVFSTDRAI